MEDVRLAVHSNLQLCSLPASDEGWFEGRTRASARLLLQATMPRIRSWGLLWQRYGERNEEAAKVASPNVRDTCVGRRLASCVPSEASGCAIGVGTHRGAPLYMSPVPTLRFDDASCQDAAQPAPR